MEVRLCGAARIADNRHVVAQIARMARAVLDHVVGRDARHIEPRGAGALYDSFQIRRPERVVALVRDDGFTGQRRKRREEVGAPLAVLHRAASDHVAEQRAVGQAVGVARRERDAHRDDSYAVRARTGDQSCGRIDEHRAFGIVRCDPDTHQAIGVQHVVLIVHGEQGGLHMNTSSASCGASQLSRSTRFIRMRKLSPSRCNVCSTLPPKARCASLRHSSKWKVE